MNNQIQISVDPEVYDRLLTLMVPPFSDANAVIKELLYQDDRISPVAVAVGAAERHFTYAQKLERSMQGVYECGGGI